MNVTPIFVVDDRQRHV